MTPEERAKAVVAYFPAIPPRIRPEVEAIVTRAIKRAVNQVLAELERHADRGSIFAEGKGKQAKGRDAAAVYWQRWWAVKLRKARERGDVSRSTPLADEVPDFRWMR